MFCFILCLIIVVICFVMKNHLIALYNEIKLKVMHWWNNDGPGNWF